MTAVEHPGVVIEELANHPHVGPTLARWHVEEFGHLYDPAVWNIGLAIDELAAMDTPGRIPTTFVAFDGPGREIDDVVGSVSLIASDDLAGFEDLTPWLASLFVRPEARGRALGEHLVQCVLDRARALGHPRVHLFTAGQADYYLARGWRVLATTWTEGHEAVVMVRETAPVAARRAVCSRWSTDPDTAGAYSYVRVGGHPDARDTLAGPVLEGLWLAGEATWRPHPATMHGAWFSGARAAEQVLGHLGASGRTPERSVLVVGAGLAGISAARSLRAAGVDVVVVESTDRLGGRAAVDRSLGAPVPLGGAWLHGVDGHPLAALVDSRPDSWDDDTTYWIDHGPVEEADLAAARAAHDRVHAALEQSEATASAGDVARDVLARAELTPAADATVRAWIRSEFESLYAAPLDDISARHGWEPYELPGGDHVITGRLGEAIDELAAGLDVRLGHRVGELTRRGTRWRTDTGLSADAVIVTVPSAALRAGRIAFDPPLPSRVVGAMEQLGAGPVCKLFVTYDTAWWPAVRAVRIAGDSPLVLGVDVTALLGVPSLCWFAVGDDARRIEAMTEDEQCRLADAVAARAGLHAERRPR